MNKDKLQSLDPAFHPRSIAIIGVSTQEESWVNKNFFRAILDFQFPGPIYPVNPRGGELKGHKVYPSLKAVPGPVDYALCAVPEALAKQCLMDAIEKGVKVLAFYTAGFREKDEEGLQKEKEFTALARSAGLRIIGPNCMGIYSPKDHFSYSPFFPREPGDVSYLSQSGGNSAELVEMVAYRGIRFSKVISYGNAIDVNESDLIEYYGRDNETRIILAYIEGIRGNKFFSVLREAASRKPVIITKGGQTPVGSQATLSHTGSIAGDFRLWPLACRQAGAVMVENIQEMADSLVAFYYLPPLTRANIGIVGIGGGASVQAADACEKEGLTIPPYPEDLQRELRSFITQAGTSVKNPLDSSVAVIWHAPTMLRTLRAVASCPDVDLILLQPPVQLGLYHLGEDALQEAISAVVQAKKEISKPIVVVLRHSASPQTSSSFFNLQKSLVEAGMPVYPDIHSATWSLGIFHQYHKKKIQITKTI